MQLLLCAVAFMWPFRVMQMKLVKKPLPFMIIWNITSLCVALTETGNAEAEH